MTEWMKDGLNKSLIKRKQFKNRQEIHVYERGEKSTWRMNEWMNERMNEWLYEWVNEWMHKLPKVLIIEGMQVAK